MVANKILPKIIGSDTTKQILKEVDDIIVKGKVDKNPEKLLTRPKKKKKIKKLRSKDQKLLSLN